MEPECFKFKSSGHSRLMCRIRAVVKFIMDIDGELYESPFIIFAKMHTLHPLQE